jgi:DNA-binding MarR family transcriptional regulator
MVPLATRNRTLLADIRERLARRYSTSVVLYHHALAEHLHLGPTDTKCLDLLQERPGISGSQLAAATGLTTGAITGVVTRLENAGYVRRELDPHDGRKQLLWPIGERVRDVHIAVEPLRADLAAVLSRFDAHQLAAVAEFLAEGTDLTYRHAALLRAQSFSTKPPSADQGPVRADR